MRYHHTPVKMSVFLDFVRGNIKPVGDSVVKNKYLYIVSEIINLSNVIEMY